MLVKYPRFVIISFSTIYLSFYRKINTYNNKL